MESELLGRQSAISEARAVPTAQHRPHRRGVRDVIAPHQDQEKADAI